MIKFIFLSDEFSSRENLETQPPNCRKAPNRLKIGEQTTEVKKLGKLNTVEWTTYSENWLRVSKTFSWRKPNKLKETKKSKKKKKDKKFEMGQDKNSKFYQRIAKMG